jgi:nucleoside-diphosphate-sugar epimerase
VEKLAVDDLDHIYEHTKHLWNNVKNQTIFITGGTGFFGKWLLSSFIYCNKTGTLNNKLIVLTRDSNKFLKIYPQYNTSEITYLDGDITKFVFPEQDIDFIIHAATEASATLNLEQPLLMFDTIVNGTKRVLELARVKNVKAILHTSSGAVYGEQPSSITHLNEEYMGAPDVLSSASAYGEGKRVAEMIATMYYKIHNVPSKIARCYAFAGPYLPLDGTFAFGNFILDVINKRDIIITGDGTPHRSYMYASDLMIWLWTILFNAEPNIAINVGSDESINIADLAKMMAYYGESKISVTVLKQATTGNPPKRYVPSIKRARENLKLEIKIPLSEAIKKTLQFLS